ncbi:MAG: type II toxin-antitoxin system VapC family toxin [Alphaproteobacteria bacterium]|nr:type II toxin-antitoxin system VapC family toxin [Alphaproteobacteria bacterium]
MSAGTLVETLIVAEAGGFVDDLTALLEEIGIEIVPVDTAQAALALDGFRRFGKGRHPAGLNYGNLFAYALARAADEPLLFVGNDFAKTDLRVA